jgi:hypothetical protein
MTHGRKKPRQPRWPVNFLALESTFAKVRTFDSEEAALLANETRMAWHHLTHGKGSTDHFDIVANSLNAALMLCEPIGQAAVDVVIRAQQAAVEMKARYLRTGSFGADATALADVPPGLDLYVQLLGFSNPLQIVRAISDSWQRIREGDVLVPLQAPQAPAQEARA